MKFNTAKKVIVNLNNSSLILTTTNAVIENKWNYIAFTIYGYPQKSYVALHIQSALESIGPTLTTSAVTYVNTNF